MNIRLRGSLDVELKTDKKKKIISAATEPRRQEAYFPMPPTSNFNASEIQLTPLPPPPREFVPPPDMGAKPSEVVVEVLTAYREKAKRATDRSKLGNAIAAFIVLGLIGVQLYQPWWESIEGFAHSSFKTSRQNHGRETVVRAQNPSTSHIPSRIYPLPAKIKAVSVPGDCRPLGSCSRKHQGTDLPASIGTPVRAVEGGTIIEVKPNAKVGGVLGIKTDSNNEIHRYVHINRADVRLWKKGDRVETGQFLAHIDWENRNWGSGPHLHFERWLPDGLDWRSQDFLEGLRS